LYIAIVDFKSPVNTLVAMNKNVFWNYFSTITFLIFFSREWS